MASFKMENDVAAVVIDEHASEIHSFVNKETGLEYMWNGDSKFWAGRNPTLFPLVGTTWDNLLHIDGKEYPMGRHGFTRRSDFTCIRHSDEEVVMELHQNEETLKQYPFAFTLRVTYTLKGAELTIAYEVINDNEQVMPFNFGLHPAFRCPIDQKDWFEDYYVEFSDEESFEVNGKKYEHVKKYELNSEELAKTVIINDPKSSWASLTNGKHGVKVGCAGYRWLALWSVNAPLVAIEPWYSHMDFEKLEIPFEKREGTMFLAPHDKFDTSYTITVY